MNPYYPCVLNGMKNRKQLTVTFHVNNLKLSHTDPFEIKLFACYLSSIYGNNLVVHQGKLHDYPGKKFDLSEKGKVRIDIIPLLENIFELFPEDIGLIAISPYGDHLYKIMDKLEALYPPEEQAVAFHHSTTQLLYISPIQRRYIQTTVDGPVAGKHSNRRSLPYASSMAYLGRTTGRHWPMSTT